MALSSGGSDSNDLGQVLRWVGLAFIGVFCISTVLGLFPVALLQPVWQLRLADALVNAASLPMMGAVLVLLADRFTDRAGPLKLVGALRRLALVAALGFLLLIPLQIVANVVATRGTINQATTVLRKAKTDVAALAQADSPAAMDAVLARMPPNVRQAVVAINADSFVSRRDQLVDLLRPQLENATAASLRAGRERWFNTIFGSSRFTVVALLWAMGYAAVASRSANGPSLLQSIFNMRQQLASRPKAPSRPPRASKKDSAEQIERWKEAKRVAAQREAAKRQARTQRSGRPTQRPPGDGAKGLGGLLGGKGRQRPGGRRQGSVAPEWFDSDQDQPGNDG